MDICIYMLGMLESVYECVSVMLQRFFSVIVNVDNSFCHLNALRKNRKMSLPQQTHVGIARCIFFLSYTLLHIILSSAMLCSLSSYSSGWMRNRGVFAQLLMQRICIYVLCLFCYWIIRVAQNVRTSSTSTSFRNARHSLWCCGM